MQYKQGTSRNQKILFTDTIDTIIDTENAVRVIDVFVETLDIEKLGFKNHAGIKTGDSSLRDMISRYPGRWHLGWPGHWYTELKELRQRLLFYRGLSQNREVVFLSSLTEYV